MFKILSLDGGGIRGTYTAAVLAELESQLGQPITKYFDLIVGTSTGGIIALGLGSKISAEDILEFYLKAGLRIFPPPNQGWLGLINKIFTPQYDNEILTKCLYEVFGARKFCDIDHKIAITSFDAASGYPVVFKSKYPKPVISYKKHLSVVDVALATSAAPTYFPAARTGAGVMIDGGVWANCPVMVGVIDAIDIFKCAKENIYILSIGTTTTPEFIKKPLRDGGVFEWAKPIPTVLMHATKLASIEQAKKLSGTFIRVDDVVESGRFDLDDCRAIGDLEQMGRGIVQRMFAELKSQFFT